MIVECQNCFAPLDIPPGAQQVDCCYCSVTNYAKRAKTIQPQTPPGWQPPPQWTAPQNAPAPSHIVLPYRGSAPGVPPPGFGPPGGGQWGPPPVGMGAPNFSPSTPSNASWLGVGLALAGVGVIAVIGLGGVVAGMSGGGFGWDEKSTLVCKTNGHITVEGVDATVDDGPVIELNTNCSLEIVDSTLRGDTIVEAGMNNRIEIVNSTLVADDTAIVSNVNVEVDISDESRIEAERLGIDLGNSGQVTIRDSKLIVTKGSAIASKINGKVRCYDSELEGVPTVEGVGELLGPDVTTDNCQLKGPSGDAGKAGDESGDGVDPSSACGQLFARWDACKDELSSKDRRLLQTSIEAMRETSSKIPANMRETLNTGCSAQRRRLDRLCK